MYGHAASFHRECSKSTEAVDDAIKAGTNEMDEMPAGSRTAAEDAASGNVEISTDWQIGEIPVDLLHKSELFH